jgi:hypothetical protein
VNNIADFLVGIVVGDLNKLQKGVWRENPIKCIHTWANDSWYINIYYLMSFYHNFKQISIHDVYRNE